jgi:hypothetical protein
MQITQETIEHEGNGNGLARQMPNFPLAAATAAKPRQFDIYIVVRYIKRVPEPWADQKRPTSSTGNLRVPKEATAPVEQNIFCLRFFLRSSLTQKASPTVCSLSSPN